MKLKRKVSPEELEWAKRRIKVNQRVLESGEYPQGTSEWQWLQKEIWKLEKWVETGERYKLSADDVFGLIMVFFVSGLLGVAALFFINWIFG